MVCLASCRRNGQKNGLPPADSGNHFQGKKLSNQTHEFTTDGEELLARKGKRQGSQIELNCTLLTENRNGPIVNTETLQAKGTAERDAALLMRGAAFVAECRHPACSAECVANVKRLRGSASCGVAGSRKVSSRSSRRQRAYGCYCQSATTRFPNFYEVSRSQFPPGQQLMPP